MIGRSFRGIRSVGNWCILATFALLMSFVVIAVPTAAQGASSSEGTIDIGSVGTYSGPLAPTDDQELDGFKAWVDYENAHGGLDGRKIVLTTADDGASPSTFFTLTEHLVQADHVVAFSDAAAQTIQGGTSYLAEQGIPVVGIDGDSTAYNKEPNLFSASLSTNDSGASFVEMDAKYEKGKLVGGIYCTEISSCEQAYTQQVALGSQYGVKFGYQAGVSISSTDFTPECIAAKAAGVQVLFVAEAVPGVIALGEQCSAQNYHPIVEASPGDITTAVAAASSYLEGSLYEGQVVPPFAGGKGLKTFDEWYKKVTPTAPGDFSVTGWVQGLIYQYASKYFPKTGTVTSADILTAIHKINGSTLGGLSAPLNWGKSGHANPGTPCFYPVKLEQGKFTALTGTSYVCAKS